MSSVSLPRLHLGDVGPSECLQQHRLSLVVLVMSGRNEPPSTTPALNALVQNTSGLGTPPLPRPLLHAGPGSARTSLVCPFPKRTTDRNGATKG